MASGEEEERSEEGEETKRFVKIHGAKNASMLRAPNGPSVVVEGENSIPNRPIISGLVTLLSSSCTARPK